MSHEPQTPTVVVNTRVLQNASSGCGCGALAGIIFLLASAASWIFENRHYFFWFALVVLVVWFGLSLWEKRTLSLALQKLKGPMASNTLEVMSENAFPMRGSTSMTVLKQFELTLHKDYRKWTRAEWRAWKKLFQALPARQQNSSDWSKDECDAWEKEEWERLTRDDP